MHQLIYKIFYTKIMFLSTINCRKNIQIVIVFKSRKKNNFIYILDNALRITNFKEKKKLFLHFKFLKEVF